MATVTFCGITYPIPDLSNECSSQLGEIKRVKNWASKREGYENGCKSISKEWEVSDLSESNKSYYRTYKNLSVEMNPKPSCDQVVEGVSGLVCTRNDFFGNPLTCCIKNYDCNPSNPNLCWSDSSRNKTCSPDQRYLYGAGCEKPLEDYCVGNDLSFYDPSWMKRWGNTGICTDLVREKLFLGKDPEGDRCNVIIPKELTENKQTCESTYAYDFNSEGYYWAKNLMSRVFEKYYLSNNFLGNKIHDEFENILYNQICCPFSGLCESGLYESCKNHTSETLLKNPLISRWCGCFLPIENYQKYSIDFNISKECTPMCNRFGTIQNSGINNLPVTCKQNVCIIDNVTVNLNNSYAGDIEINQICRGCDASTNCSCIISDQLINVKDSEISGKIIAATQTCGRTTCQVNNPGAGPNSITTDCNQDSSIISEYQKRSTENETKSTLFSVLINIGLLLIGMIIFGITYYFLKKR